MYLLRNVSGLFTPAQPQYSPLGLAPYQKPNPRFFGNSQSEFDIGIKAIDKSFDAHPELPEHVHEFGRVALYSELTKQASRNTIQDTSDVPQLALEGRMPADELALLMDETDFLRAIEFGRLTDVNERDVQAKIHKPMTKALLGNPEIDATHATSRRRFKLEFISPEIVTIGVKQKRMELIGGSIMLYCRQLFILDLLDPDNPLHNNIDKSLSRTLIPHIDKDAQYPDWLIPGVTTYYGAHPDRLDELKRLVRQDEMKREYPDEQRSQRQYDISPNLPVDSYRRALK